MKPGYYSDMDLTTYLRDPCDEPSLSKGTILDLVNSSPRRAHSKHCRFGNRRSDDSARGDIGSAVHSVAGVGAKIFYVDKVTKRSGKDKGVEFVPEDWKTQDAKDARDAIRNSGGLPMLEHQRPIIEAAGNNARAMLESFGPGKSEVTMIFQHNDVTLRTRPDYLTDTIDAELKTCEDADFDAWARRTVETSGYDVQMAMRWLGHKTLGHERKMRWVLQEIENDLETVWADVSQELIDVGIRKINHACKLWRRCLDSNVWPGYQSGGTVMPTSAALWNLEARGVE